MQYKEFKDGIRLSRLGMGVMRLPVVGQDDAVIDYKEEKEIIDLCIPEEKKPSACIRCGSCTEHCPQGYHIPEYMEEMKNMMEQG